ncbi:MAG: LLM class flavin-dependent oxidoreductase [Nitrososphaerota archaeon]|nr:LLM class flavin-dependent oxidoreductase [Nitrososphaerota archaeon]
MSRIDASFGVALPAYAGDATGTPGAEEYWGLYDMTLNDEVSWDRVAGFAKSAESLGYESLWSPDHFMLGKDGNSLEVWTTLSAVSQITRKVKLGTWVACNNYRNPALVAKMASSLAVMSANRFVLGYGAGWYELEYRALGYEFPPPGQRVDMMIEGIEVIQGLMKEKKFSYKGKYYTVDGMVNNPKPTEKVPLLIGGWGKRVIGVAAKYADEWDIGAEPTYAEYKQKVDLMKEELRKNGRRDDSMMKSVHVHVLIAEDEDELREKKARVMAVLNALGPSVVQLPSADYRFDIDKAIVGTPDQVKERLKGYVDLGCQRFELMFMDYPKYKSMELFSSTIL